MKDLLKELNDDNLAEVERKATALLEHAEEQRKAAKGVLTAIAKVRELSGSASRAGSPEVLPADEG